MKSLIDRAFLITKHRQPTALPARNQRRWESADDFPEATDRKLLERLGWVAGGPECCRADDRAM